MDLQLADFVERIKSCSTAEQAARQFIAFGEQQGACTVTTFFGTSRENQFVSSLPDWFVKLFHESGAVLRAHMVLSVRAGAPSTYHGIDICPHNPNASKEGITHSWDAFDHLQRRSGVTFAMPDEDGNYSGAGMGLGFEDKGDIFLKRMTESCSAFGVAAFAAYSRMALLRNQLVAPSPLSPRQQQVLQYLAAGYKTDGIADRLNITVSAVNLYLFNLKKKLKVKTREQALAQALINGWIEL